MNKNSNFRSTPPGDDEWWKIWRLVQEWDENRTTIEGIRTLVAGAVLVKKVAPYAAFLGFVALAAYNKAAVIAFLGGTP